MRGEIVHLVLIIKKEGNRAHIGLAANLSYPLEKRYFGNPFFNRCKGFIEAWQRVSLAQAEELSAVWGEAVVGPRICDAVL
jgi:hypothetical protein